MARCRCSRAVNVKRSREPTVGTRPEWTWEDTVWAAAARIYGCRREPVKLSRRDCVQWPVAAAAASRYGAGASVAAFQRITMDAVAVLSDFTKPKAGTFE